MNIETLIEQLLFIKSKHGNLDVVLDDLVSRNCLDVDFIGVEHYKNDVNKGLVVVIKP